MRILLDECVPWPLQELLVGHDCSVQRHGWTGIKDGDLLRLAAGEFDLFITSDEDIRYQQDLLNPGLAVLQLSTNDLRRIRAATAAIHSAIEMIDKEKFQELAIP